MKNMTKLLKNKIDSTLQNIEPDRESIKVVLDRILFNSYVNEYNIVCDETNNYDDNFINVDITIKTKAVPSFIAITTVIGKNKIRELKNLRKKKLNTIYHDNIEE